METNAANVVNMTVLFNDEDFHSVEILETVVWSAGSQEEISFL
jgi:hypothetical protein